MQEKQDRIASLLSSYSIGGYEKISTDLIKDIKESFKSKKPSVFLGGRVTGDDWRKKIKEEYGDSFFFLDPFDRDWSPEENIYKELAGLVNADYTIFYEGGEGSEKEQGFLEISDIPYKKFTSLKSLESYLDVLKDKPKLKKASISQNLVKIAADILSSGFFSIRLADDMSGKVHQEKERRIILNTLPEECKGIKPSIIKQGILREAKKDGEVLSYARIRMKKDPGKDAQYSLGVKNFRLHQEAETEVSKQMFNSFYPDFLDRPQEKKRYKLPNGWEIDVMEDKIVGEFEEKGNRKYQIPEHWDVKEVKNYKMASYGLSSVQVQIPARFAKKMQDYGKQILPIELGADGLEKESHVTVFYGILSDKPDQVKELLKECKPFPVTIKETGCFTTSPQFDVLFCNVNSPSMVMLHKKIKETCPSQMTYPNYNPHATIAYLKKGYGPKYSGKDLGGITFTVREVIFSSKNGKKTKIRLGS